ncbi:hypothetical protein BSL78_13798 [Apostichopus japonicus]|uniref:Thioredoxin domain-containing protein n=1 Tax=Stichopus japonicus TaxID=307972 RepID=A0A2G8KMU8_STIJA|nr:hypothetical protein BSL78_13798 [Apostichopus japonicus]
MFRLDDALCFLILPSVFILTIVSCSSQDDIETEELSFGGVEVVQLETEDVSGDEDSRFLELFPTPSPPKEADIEYILKQVEIRKLQARAYQALEKLSDCLYSYRDVALQGLMDDTCYASLPSGSWQVSDTDIGTQVQNTTCKFPYPCSLRTVSENATLSSTSSGGVSVVNASECLRILEKEPETDEYGASKQHCAVVLFFSRQCPFSVEMAPDFNALGRAFPGVDIMAVDVSQSSGLYTRYGIVAVPDILLFHRRKPVLRFNYTERSYENLVTFLRNNTGLEPKAEIEVSTVDLEGPLTTTLVTQPDYLLLFSNAFVILFTIYIVKQRLGDSILQRVREYMDYARQVWRRASFMNSGVHDNEDGGFG